jgi:hypothetical protein
MPYYGAITHPMFKPAVRDIASITNSLVPTVTTTFPHSYLTGLIARMVIPPDFGMVQLNNIKSVVTVTSPTTFTITISTVNFDPFVVPMESPQEPLVNPAQVVPIGEQAAILTQSFVNVLTPQF